MLRFLPHRKNLTMNKQTHTTEKLLLMEKEIQQLRAEIDKEIDRLRKILHSTPS